MNHSERQNVEVNRRKLQATFASLRAHGYVARQNFSCCGSCAACELTDLAVAMKQKGRTVRGAVYYHQQDHETMLSTGRVHIGFGPLHHTPDGQPEEVLGEDAVTIGQEVVAALRARNLHVTWNGSEHERILVDLTQPPTTMDERGIITSGTCKPGCGATVGYAHKMSCSQGAGKGLRFNVTRK